MTPGLKLIGESLLAMSRITHCTDIIPLFQS